MQMIMFMTQPGTKSAFNYMVETQVAALPITYLAKRYK